MRSVWLALLLVVAGCAATSPEEGGLAKRTASFQVPSWAMEGGDPARSSRSASKAPVRWELRGLIALSEGTRFHPEEYATPLVIEGVVYVGHSGRAFEAVRLSDGKVLWKVSTRGRVYTTAAFAEGLLIFGDDEGLVYALKLDGSEAWRFPVRYPVVSSPIAAQGKVYVAVADQNVFCLETATGRPIWQYGRPFPRKNALWRSLGIAFGQGRVYAGFSDGTVAALNAEIGQVVWKVELGAQTMFGDVTAGPSFGDGSVYVGVFRGPTVCLDAATGKETWRQKAETVTGFALGEDLIYAGTPSGTLLALSRADGERVWEASLDGGVPTLPVLTADAVLVGASEGSLHGFDRRSGAALGQYFPGSGLRSQPLPMDKGVLFLSNGGSLSWVN